MGSLTGEGKYRESAAVVALVVARGVVVSKYCMVYGENITMVLCRTCTEYTYGAIGRRKKNNHNHLLGRYL
jgi:hypothetical protein